MTAMSMCYFGAKNETAQQLKEVLDLSNLSETEILDLNHKYLSNIKENLGKDVDISTANKIYPMGPVEKEFLDIVTKQFNSDVQPLDYSNPAEATKTINQWVSEQTRNKINNLIPLGVLSVLTKMVLVNAIYFKGNWINKFKPEMTIKKDFHDIDGKTSLVDMMHLSGKKFLYLSHPSGEMIKLIKYDKILNPRNQVFFSLKESKQTHVLFLISEIK